MKSLNFKNIKDKLLVGSDVTFEDDVCAFGEFREGKNTISNFVENLEKSLKLRSAEIWPPRHKILEGSNEPIQP